MGVGSGFHRTLYLHVEERRPRRVHPAFSGEIWLSGHVGSREAGKSRCILVILEDGCCALHLCVSPNSYVETLTPKVLGSRVLGATGLYK
jgi:hypothetical protein